MIAIAKDLSVAAGLVVLLLAALEAGFRAGRRAASEADGRSSGQVGAVQGALLGLLGLLLAFSFAAAGGRFLEKQDLIVQEANAIGTAWLRADLLEEPHRSELRAALQRFLGLPEGLRQRQAVLAHGWPANDQRQDYLRGFWVDEAGRQGATVRTAERQDSSMQATLAAADVLVVRPPFDSPRAAGHTVSVVDLPEALGSLR